LTFRSSKPTLRQKLPAKYQQVNDMEVAGNAVASTPELSPAAASDSNVTDMTVPRRRLGELVASVLLGKIRLHEYLPGERMPSEGELCEQLGVNRLAVREGLRWLENQGYIHVKSGRYGGAFVLEPSRALARQRLEEEAAQLGGWLEFRQAVEPYVVKLAARRIRADELAQLEALLAAADADEATMSRQQILALDTAFHQAVAAAARSPRLAAAVREIRLSIGPGMDLFGFSLRRRRQSSADHAEIVAALRARDGERAAQLMEAHVALTARDIERILRKEAARAQTDQDSEHERDERTSRFDTDAE
jgi:GntR family transcriptional regulator, transcriptional repressor for pyruvate dehydrogenase complex